MAGNGTIGLEILEDLPDVDAVVVPWGGGGLTTGIASAIKALAPDVRIYAAEPETAAPADRHARRAARRRRSTTGRRSSTAPAPGRCCRACGRSAEPLLDGAFAVSLDETAAAVRLLAERARVIAEGAGALATAVALSGRVGGGKVVCIVSGGNIDFEKLATILGGETPGNQTAAR